MYGVTVSLVGWLVLQLVDQSVRPLVGQEVGQSVGWLFWIGRSVIISLKGGKLHVHAPIGALFHEHTGSVHLQRKSHISIP